MEYIGITLMAYIVTLIAIFVMRPIAKLTGLIDKPGGRKKHAGDIPLIGGPSVLIGLGVTLFALEGELSPWLLGSILFIVTVGIIDDRFQISPLLKLGAQIITASTAVIFGGVVITNFGMFFMQELLGSYIFCMAFTIIAITGLINAFNMIDGIDGLAASLSLFSVLSFNLSFFWLGIEASEVFFIGSMSFIGALIAFLMVNLQIIGKQKIFLGDSGSMVLGYCLSILLIKASEGSITATYSAVPTALILWTVAIPVADTLSLIVRRTMRGRSPFSPDRTHLHHLILDLGFTARQTLLVIVIMASSLYGLGLAVTLLGSNTIGIASFGGFLILYFVTLSRLSASRRNKQQLAG